MSDDEDDALTVGVQADTERGVVQIRFLRPVEHLAVPADDARRFAQLLLKKADEAKP